MANLTEAIYWCARDLDGVPIGNHHFILLVTPDTSELFPGTPPIQEDTPSGRVSFYTIGAFKREASIPDLLTAVVNDKTDLQAVKEYIYPEKYTTPLQPDLDLEPHMIQPPTESLAAFRSLVIELTQIYQAKGNIQYSLLDANCSAWVNTLLKVAGVSNADRKAAGDFFGIDWGEDSLVPEKYFRI